jgi:hypothetical protein
MKCLKSLSLLGLRRFFITTVLTIRKIIRITLIILTISESGCTHCWDNVLQRRQVYDGSKVDLQSENMRAFNQRKADDLIYYFAVGQGL